MKRFSALVLLLLVIILLVCCTSDKGDVSAGEYYVTFTDDNGTNISFAEKPKKAAVLFSSYAQMVLLSGGSVDVTVGETLERGFAKEGTPLVDDGAGKKINTELLIAQKPDIVIGSYDIAAHRETAELLNKSGIPTALFRVESFSDYERVMRILCDIFEGDELYEKNVEKVKKEIDIILSSIPKGQKKKILFVRCSSSSKATKAKTKDESFVCGMLDEMNTYNIAENAHVLLDGLSIEEIIAENPDCIFFSTMGDEDAAKKYMTGVLESDEWQTLTAVKKGNYTFLDKELFQYKPNNRWDEAYKILAELLYGKK